MNMYHKVRFTSSIGSTAGLILTDKQVKLHITEISRMFPYSEAMKMATFQVSPAYETWEQAFAHEFA